ncbi:hypothetical protein FRB94_000257 [Tulasnella sp. JGI-2019a]|nr:hypothetical protein FRB94_000257 [Tulasnella sp. JGI-2019a]
MHPSSKKMFQSTVRADIKKCSSLLRNLVSVEVPTVSDQPPRGNNPFTSYDSVLRQIENLNSHPAAEYILHENPDRVDDDAVAVKLDELPGAVAFTIMRNRIMTSDDISTMLYVYRVLQTIAAMKRLRTGAVMTEQLSRQYGATWDKMKALEKKGQFPESSKIEREDVDVVIDWLRNTSRFKEELEAYVTGSGKAMPLGLQVGPRKDYMVVMHFPKGAGPPPAVLDPLGKSTFPIKRRTAKEIRENPGPNDTFPEPKTPHIPHAGVAQADQLDTPDVPLQLTFLDPLDAAAFLAFRHRLFMHGGYDIDTLAYLVVVLEPTLRRKKIAPGATLKQLSDEYGEEYVDYAKSPIHNGRYHRRDGKIFTPGDMPVEREEITPIFTQVKASGRMDGLFALSKQA